MTLAVAFTVAVLTTTEAAPRSPVQPNAGCLHEPGREVPAERDRSLAALAATRAINTAQAGYSAKNNRTYAGREQLVGYIDTARYNRLEGAEIVPGFTLTLDTSDKGYWFMIADRTDPCGFRYISNQQGVIFVAQPIR